MGCSEEKNDKLIVDEVIVMRMLFLCNTLYQIIGACSIREMYPNAEAEIILSDHTNANKQIQKNMERMGLIFDKSYFVETKYLYKFDNGISNKERNQIIKNIRTIPTLVDISDHYDMFFCANAEPFTERLVNYIKHMNSKATINWFEDGLSAYSFDKRYFPTWKRRGKNYIQLLFQGIYHLTSVVDNYYVFQPDKMEWRPRAQIIKIDLLSEKLVGELGRLFSFQNCVDKYEEKYIFFEDGARDWNDTTDVDLVQKIAEMVGKENILVRIHPRNPVNRFQKLGFKTNQDVSVPWEVIAGNIDIENKILLTMYSQSVVTPDILLGKKGTVILLGLLDKNCDMNGRDIFEYMNRKYFSLDREHYFVPKDMGEFKDIMMWLE